MEKKNRIKQMDCEIWSMFHSKVQFPLNTFKLMHSLWNAIPNKLSHNDSIKNEMHFLFGSMV